MSHQSRPVLTRLQSRELLSRGRRGFLVPKQPFMLFSPPPPPSWISSFFNFCLVSISRALSSWLPHPGIDGPRAWIVTTVFSQDHPRPSPKIISQPQNEFTVLLIYPEMEYKMMESEKKHDPICPKHHRHPEQIKSLPQNESGQTLSSGGGQKLEHFCAVYCFARFPGLIYRRHKF